MVYRPPMGEGPGGQLSTDTGTGARLGGAPIMTKKYVLEMHSSMVNILVALREVFLSYSEAHKSILV